MEVPGDKLTASVAGLTHGEEYQFRIIPVNKAGPGETSDPSDRIVAKPRFCESFHYQKFLVSFA